MLFGNHFFVLFKTYLLVPFPARSQVNHERNKGAHLEGDGKDTFPALENKIVSKQDICSKMHLNILK